MSRYLLGLVAMLFAIAAVQTARVGNLKDQLAVSGIKVEGCNARLSNILEDQQSDQEIDNLSDDDLRNAPDSWMLPAESGSE